MSENELEVEDKGPKSGPESPEGERVLAVFAHPDDAEFVCGGTLARWASEGKDITLCLVTNGDKGSDDPEMTHAKLHETRKTEQARAAEILGISDVIWMGREDGVVVPDLELRLALARVMRRVRPDILVNSDPSIYWSGSEYINHPDHRAVAEASLAAAFPAAGNRLYFPELLEEGLEPYKITQIYLASPGEPDTYIDISDFMSTKIEALRAHKSQMGEWDPDGPIREWNVEDGKKRNPPVAYAEDFKYFKTSG